MPKPAGDVWALVRDLDFARFAPAAVTSSTLASGSGPTEVSYRITRVYRVESVFSLGVLRLNFVMFPVERSSSASVWRCARFGVAHDRGSSQPRQRFRPVIRATRCSPHAILAAVAVPRYVNVSTSGALEISCPGYRRYAPASRAPSAFCQPSSRDAAAANCGGACLPGLLLPGALRALTWCVCCLLCCATGRLGARGDVPSWRRQRLRKTDRD